MEIPKILPKDRQFVSTPDTSLERHNFGEEYFVKRGIEQNRLAPIEEQAKTIRLSKSDKAAWQAFREGERTIRKGSLMDWKAEEQGNKILADLWAKYEVAIPKAEVGMPEERR